MIFIYKDAREATSILGSYRRVGLKQPQGLYLQIIEDFGFSREADEAVAAELDRLLDGTRASADELGSLFRGQVVTVAGNGPSLGSDLKGAEGVLVTADEATTVALEQGRHPAVLVTDLDGRVEDQLRANAAGAESACPYGVQPGASPPTRMRV